MADAAHGEDIVEIWKAFLNYGEVARERRLRRFFSMLPKDPRCKMCHAPFRGIGSTFTRLAYGKRPSQLNPRLCNVCEEFAHQNQGGAEVEVTMLFADVRGSTTLAEGLAPAEFSRLIDRFYRATTDVLIRSDALIDKLIGDEVVGMYLPGHAGRGHALRALEAARELLRVTGQGDPGGPWIPVGVGVHSGTAFVGAVGAKDGVVDITALGDAPNVAARLASQAAPGEILASLGTVQAAGIALEGLEQRRLALKGRNEPVDVVILRL